VGLPLLDFGPKPLEVVKLPLLRREDVDDRVAEIEQNPAAVRMALHPLDRVPLRFRALDDFVDDCAGLNLRTAGHDDKRIGEDRAAAYVDSNKIFALFLERGVAYDVD
jgi:hypothetical protein